MEQLRRLDFGIPLLQTKPNLPLMVLINIRHQKAS
jgi:hypothetical protein